MSEPAPERCGIVVAHGSLAEGLLSGLARVTGRQENLWAVSNDGLGRDALIDAVREIVLREAGGREVFLFSDMSGGSCGQACRRLLDERLARAAVYGVNLPLLVEFVFLQAEPLDTLLAALVSKSRGAIGATR